MTVVIIAIHFIAREIISVTAVFKRKLASSFVLLLKSYITKTLELVEHKVYNLNGYVFLSDESLFTISL